MEVEGSEPKVIAVDGPAGSGKTTVCTELARRLGFVFLSSGIIYRAIAWFFRNISKEQALEDFLKNLRSLPLNVVIKNGCVGVNYEEESIAEKLHDPEIANLASFLARMPEVREFANEIQRSISKKVSIVVEGRDTTTVVFPDACLKVFLTATPEERAKRRWKELVSKGIDVGFDDVLRSVIGRDKADSERSLAPLTKDPEALFIDSTGMDVEEVVRRIIDVYRSKQCKSSSQYQ